MTTTAAMRESLRDKVLFSEFSDEELDAFLALLDREEFADGARIVTQDASGDCMYLLVSGCANVIHHRDQRQVHLATLQPGDFFGEIALIDCGPRSADVVACGPCLLLKITRAAVSALAGVYPTAGFKFLIGIGRLVVARLRQSNQRYLDSMFLPVSTP